MAVFHTDIPNNSTEPKYAKYKIENKSVVTATLGYQAGLLIDLTDSAYRVKHATF